jgi:hypothetical protein
MPNAIASRPASSLDAFERRLAMGVFVSVLLHGLVLSLQFGIPGLRPGPGGPITVRLMPAPAVVPAPPQPLPVPPPTPAPVAAVPAPQAVAPLPSPKASRHGFQLVDPVAPAPPAPAPAPPPRRVVKRRRKPPATRVADGLHTRVIAQELHQDNTFDVPLPAVEPDPAPDPLARAEPPAEVEKPVEDDAAAGAEAKAERTRLAEESEREREQRREADEARLRLDAENRLLLDAARQRQQLVDQSAQFEAALADEAKARARQEEAQRAAQLAEQRRLEQERAQQMAEQQRIQQAEPERAQQLAEQQRIQQAEQERAQQLAEQQRIQLAEQERARQLAEQQRIQQAEQDRARQLAEQRRAEEAARLAQEQARRDRERALATAAGPAAAPAPGPAPAGAGDDAGRGNGTLPRGALGSDLASRAREMMHGIDILKPVPRAVRPAEDAARALRRALAEAARHDIPLRMYIDSVRQKIERNAVLSDAQLSADVVRTDPIVSIAIRSDGSVEDVVILRSSGRADIDEFVRRIVRLNARYSAFPPNVAANYDVIELRRVWRFAGALRLLEEMR